MTREKVVERDMKVRGLVRNDAKNGVKWRAVMGSKKANSHKSAKKWPQNVCCCCCWTGR